MKKYGIVSLFMISFGAQAASHPFRPGYQTPLQSLVQFLYCDDHVALTNDASSQQDVLQYDEEIVLRSADLSRNDLMQSYLRSLYSETKPLSQADLAQIQQQKFDVNAWLDDMAAHVNGPAAQSQKWYKNF